MKNTDSRFGKVLCLSFVFCAMAFFDTAIAGGLPQAKTNAPKVISAAQKNAASVTQQHAQLMRDEKNVSGAKAGVRTDRRADISRGHLQTALQAKPIPSPAPPPPFSALQREMFPESQNASSLHPAASSVSDAAEAEDSGSAQIFLVIVALCAALAGTAVILYLIANRSPQKEIVKDATQALSQKVQPQMIAPLSLETVPLEKSEAGVQYEVTTEEGNAVIELAQRYQRGQGEMQLLFSIQAHETDEAPLTNLLHTSPSSKVKGKTIKRAKEIGLGKTEVDLLLRLQKCGTSANHSVRIL
jgi:hypothetical protein